MLPSMGSVGDAYDNAMCESFFATLECGCWTGAGSRPKPTPRWPASASSKAGTTPYAYIPAWATARRWHTKQPQQQRRWPKHRRSHRSLPTLHQSGSTSYLLTLKGNHKLAHAAVVEHFDERCFYRGAASHADCDAFDDTHGRLVRRRVFASTEAAALDALSG